MRAKLIFLERKLRILLYGFVVYSLMCCVVINLFVEQADNILHNYIFIIVGGLFSFCAGLVIDEEVEKTKEICEWSWEAETKSDYYCTEFCGLVSIGALYFQVQMGIGMIFFPEFEQVTIGSEDQHLYPFVFLFNSIVIYIMYRLTIIKINYIKQEDDVN